MEVSNCDIFAPSLDGITGLHDGSCRGGAGIGNSQNTSAR